MFFQPPPTAAVAPSSRVLLSRTSRALLSRLRADFCSSCWIFSVVLVSYRNKTEVSSCDPSRRRRSRARPSRCLFRAGIGRLWGVTGGDVPVPGDVPGDGGEAARRFGCSTAREAMPASARRAGVTGVGVGGRVSESLRGLSRTRGSCRRNVGRRVGNGGRSITLGVDAAAHDLRRAHDTTRSTPSEEEGVQGPAPRARDCFVANSALTINQSITFSEHTRLVPARTPKKRDFTG